MTNKLKTIGLVFAASSALIFAQRVPPNLRSAPPVAPPPHALVLPPVPRPLPPPTPAKFPNAPQVGPFKVTPTFNPPGVQGTMPWNPK